MENVKWDYYKKFEELNNKYMPDVGEGETVASQVVTAVTKLVYKWYNDGDVYDNTRYLEGWLNDLSSYANWLRQNVGAGEILDKIYKAETEAEYENILKELADKYINKDILIVFNKLNKTGTIYKCEGPYKFIEQYDDEDEE